MPQGARRIAHGNGCNRLPASRQCGIPSRQLPAQPGDVIFSEGDKGDKMYVIRTGEVEVERNGKIVETLAAGGIFGEMALIDGSPRAATARAKTSCEVAPITEKSFLFLVHETPFFAIAVMRALADRLRRSAP
ncbi:MAG: cyclic nucleotide-binding domain-containing protein [Methyloceanibacter sp.]|nr:cyclic nucleotide-binding domain-containing protein [Methyloceanibacter sp.]